MRFIRRSARVEDGIDILIHRSAVDNVGHDVLAPALHAITATPEPPARRAILYHRRTALRPAPNHNQPLSRLVAAGVKRREAGKHSIHFPDREIRVGIVSTFDEVVRDAVEDKHEARAADMLRRDERVG